MRCVGKTYVEHRKPDPVWNMKMKKLGTVEMNSEERIEISVSHKTWFFGDTLLCRDTIPVSRLIEVLDSYLMEFYEAF